MPLGKGNSRLDRFHRNRLRKKKGLASVKKEVKSLKKFVMKTIENKQQNTNVVDSNVLDIGFASRPYIALQQGTQDGDDRSSATQRNARVGNTITLMRSQLKFQLGMQTAGPSEVRVRLLVVESVDGNQELNFEDILQAGQNSGTLVGTSSDAYTSLYTTKTDTNKRYKIHIDKVVTLNFYRNQNYYKSLSIRYGKTGRVIEFDGNNLELVNHNLQILAISDTSSVSTCPKISYSLRHTYKDA